MLPERDGLGPCPERRGDRSDRGRKAGGTEPRQFGSGFAALAGQHPIERDPEKTGRVGPRGCQDTPFTRHLPPRIDRLRRGGGSYHAGVALAATPASCFVRQSHVARKPRTEDTRLEQSELVTHNLHSICYTTD